MRALHTKYLGFAMGACALAAPSLAAAQQPGKPPSAALPAAPAPKTAPAVPAAAPAAALAPAAATAGATTATPSAAAPAPAPAQSSAPTAAPAPAAPETATPESAPSSTATALPDAGEATRPRAPAPDAAALSISDLLNQEVDSSTFGSTKYRLPRYGISTYFHGVANLGFTAQSKADPGGPVELHEVSGHPSSFHRVGFNFFAGAEINDVVFPEIEIETTSLEEVAVRYAQIDLRVWQDYLFIRFGEFFVPFGGLNVYPSPEFVHRFAMMPLLDRHLYPAEWSQTGAQLYGRAALGGSAYTLEYAAYLVNGLQQLPDPENPGALTEGGNVYDMMENDVERFHGAKHFGGRLGITGNGLSAGVSGYTGNYAAVGVRRILLADVDLEWRNDVLTLKGEAGMTRQNITGGHLNKRSAYVLAAYRALPEVEPVTQLELLGLDQGATLDRKIAGAGFNLYPYPTKAPTVLIKNAYQAMWDGDGNFAGHRAVVILGAAF